MLSILLTKIHKIISKDGPLKIKTQYVCYIILKQNIEKMYLNYYSTNGTQMQYKL